MLLPCFHGIFPRIDFHMLAVLTPPFEFGGLALVPPADNACEDRLFAVGVSSPFHRAPFALFMDIQEQLLALQQMLILMLL